MSLVSTGETASGVVVLESAVRQYEEVLGIRHPGISTLSKKAERLLSALEPEQREHVSCDWCIVECCPVLGCGLLCSAVLGRAVLDCAVLNAQHVPHSPSSLPAWHWHASTSPRARCQL